MSQVTMLARRLNMKTPEVIGNVPDWIVSSMTVNDAANDFQADVIVHIDSYDKVKLSGTIVINVIVVGQGNKVPKIKPLIANRILMRGGFNVVRENNWWLIGVKYYSLFTEIKAGDMKLVPIGTGNHKAETKIIRSIYTDKGVYPTIADGKPMNENTAIQLVDFARQDYPVGTKPSSLGGYLNLFIVVNEQVAGHIMVRPSGWNSIDQKIWGQSVPSPFGTPMFSMMRVAVLPQYQGKGIGSRSTRIVTELYSAIYPSSPIFLSAFEGTGWSKYLENSFKVRGRTDNMILVQATEGNQLSNTLLPPPDDYNENNIYNFGEEVVIVDEPSENAEAYLEALVVRVPKLPILFEVYNQYVDHQGKVMVYDPTPKSLQRVIDYLISHSSFDNMSSYQYSKVIIEMRGGKPSNLYSVPRQEDTLTTYYFDQYLKQMIVRH